MDDYEEGKSNIRKMLPEVQRKICTGQIVITMAGACKELVENALDAGATIIEIRVKSFGVESLEVIDNGSGIHSCDFGMLCQPHATSKLSEFNDLNTLNTFGFRGEALNALSTLSDIIITTKHKEETTATKLFFDHNGHIIQQECCARSIGTTISVNNLFVTLPVRRKELERTGKREFNKLLNIVQSFAISRPDVRFIVQCYKNGKLFQLLVTDGGNGETKEVLACLFGTRFSKGSLLKIIKKEPDESVCSHFGLPTLKPDDFNDIGISGFVSSCEHGQGRNCSDRQFVFFNRRPIDYQKLCRTANDVYQRYNHGQYCMLILFIDVPTDLIDVNVAPDKKSIFFEKEKELIALLHSSLLATFAPTLGSTQPSFSLEKDLSFYDYFADPVGTNSARESSFDNGQEQCTNDREGSSIEDSGSKKLIRPPPHFLSSSSGNKRSSKTPFEGLETNPSTAKKKNTGVQKRPNALLLEQFAFKVIPHSKITSLDDDLIHKDGDLTHKEESEQSQPLPHSIIERTTKSELFDIPANINIESVIQIDEPVENTDESDKFCKSPCNDVQIEEESNVVKEDVLAFTRTQQTIEFSISLLKEKIIKKLNSGEVMSNEDEEKDNYCSAEQSGFYIDDASEQRLATHISKNDFEKMEVIGQFNKGFIIVVLRDELFIVDQHASDEIYNFERFQKKAKVQTQQLITARRLNIGAVRESILEDNMEIFNSNGFHFSFDEKAPAGQRAMLVSVPVLHNWQFSTSGFFAFHSKVVV